MKTSEVTHDRQQDTCPWTILGQVGKKGDRQRKSYYTRTNQKPLLSPSLPEKPGMRVRDVNFNPPFGHLYWPTLLAQTQFAWVGAGKQFCWTSLFCTVNHAEPH